MSIKPEDDEHYRYTVSLRVNHPSIDPDIITTTLGIKPKRCWRIGDNRTTPKGGPLEGTYKETYWYANVLEGVYPEAELTDEIKKLTSTLLPFKEFFHEIRRDGGKVEFFIGWFFEKNSGDVFTYDLLSKLSDLQIDLSFDVYPPTEKLVAADGFEPPTKGL